MATQKIALSKTLSAAASTITFAYPDGTTAPNFAAASGGDAKSVIWSDSINASFQEYGHFSVTPGSSNISVVMLNGIEFAKGETVYIELDVADSTVELADPASMSQMFRLRVNLGAPDTADPNGILESYTGAAADVEMDGALVSDGVATLDVPRNVVVDSGGADDAVVTITGTDLFGKVMVENITANGATAVPGKKAFKTVTGIALSKAAANGIFIGTGDVLGMPVYIAELIDYLAEYEAGSAASSGTFVAGVQTAPSAITGDVRGTYDPNSACNGTKAFEVDVIVRDPGYKGLPQFAG